MFCASLDCSFASAPGSSLEVRGERGTLRVADPWHIREPGLELIGEDGSGSRIPVAAANSYRLEAEDLSRAVRAGDEGAARLRLGRDDAIGQARALEMLYAAARG